MIWKHLEYLSNHTLLILYNSTLVSLKKNLKHCKSAKFEKMIMLYFHILDIEKDGSFFRYISFKIGGAGKESAHEQVSQSCTSLI